MYLRGAIVERWSFRHTMTLGTGVALLAAAFVGGIDVTRIAYPGAVLLIVLAVVALVRWPMTTAYLLVGSWVLWRFWQPVRGTEDSWGSLYYPYGHTLRSLAFALVLLVAGVVLWRVEARHTQTAAAALAA